MKKLQDKKDSNMNIFKKSKPTNQIINLSTEQKEDFFKCFIKYKFTMVET